MKHFLTAMRMALALVILAAQFWAAEAGAGTLRGAPAVSARALPVQRVQYLDFPPPRFRRLPPALRMRPRLRRPPRRPRVVVPPPRRMRRPAVKIRPSEALRLAQRRWPDSIGLSVRLLGDEPPVYVVKLRTRSRVVRVLVDARSGRVLQQ